MYIINNKTRTKIAYNENTYNLYQFIFLTKTIDITIGLSELSKS